LSLRKRAEQMAKKVKHGKRFEEDFIKSVPDRCDVTRLKDGGGWSNATNMRFTSSNPCDFIVFSKQFTGSEEGTMYKLELKTVKGKSLPFSNIKQHQLDSLCDSWNKGVGAYFVVNFREVNETYLIPAPDMAVLIELSERKSLALAMARKLYMKIEQTIKITRWRYDLSWL